MAGIYIHIPYCKQACNYCNFHFSTQTGTGEKMVQAMMNEIELQKNYFPENTLLDSIYLGGGTPSFVPLNSIIKLLQTVFNHFKIKNNVEITLEANPDDLSTAYLHELKKYTPINRLSIGIQSFVEEDLAFMHRVHTAAQAKQVIMDAQKAGFSVTCDLIYGTPTLSNENWKKNIETLIELGVQHFSCYALTVEEKTVLHHQIHHKKIPEIDEEKIATQFTILQDTIAQHGYEQYEISNFCKNGHYAVHNTNYWKNKSYLGIGPSAHSYNGKDRFWNINNNNLYIKQLLQNQLAQSCEHLNDIDHYNEYVMTNLRTIWGVDSRFIEKKYGSELRKHFEFEIKPFIDNNWVELKNNIYTLTNKGKLFCDLITEQTFWVDEHEKNV
jgi:oxygen-independent coproporphyrinogen-3 oxidase